MSRDGHNNVIATVKHDFEAMGLHDGRSHGCLAGYILKDLISFENIRTVPV